jgi:hypothetical protein
MARRKVPYAFGIPEKYTDESQGKKVPRSKKAQADLIKEGKEAYKKGEKLPDSYFKRRTMTAKKGTKTPKSKGGKKSSASLAAKAKSSGISLSTLKKVYKRGQGAYLSGGSRTGASMAAWAMGRVNSYIRGSRKHDTDLR